MRRRTRDPRAPRGVLRRTTRWPSTAAAACPRRPPAPPGLHRPQGRRDRAGRRPRQGRHARAAARATARAALPPKPALPRRMRAGGERALMEASQRRLRPGSAGPGPARRGRLVLARCSPRSTRRSPGALKRRMVAMTSGVKRWRTGRAVKRRPAAPGPQGRCPRRTRARRPRRVGARRGRAGRSPSAASSPTTKVVVGAPRWRVSRQAPSAQVLAVLDDEGTAEDDAAGGAAPTSGWLHVPAAGRAAGHRVGFAWTPAAAANVPRGRRRAPGPRGLRAMTRRRDRSRRRRSSPPPAASPAGARDRGRGRSAPARRRRPAAGRGHADRRPAAPPRTPARSAPGQSFATASGAARPRALAATGVGPSPRVADGARGRALAGLGAPGAHPCSAATALTPGAGASACPPAVTGTPPARAAWDVLAPRRALQGTRGRVEPATATGAVLRRRLALTGATDEPRPGAARRHGADTPSEARAADGCDPARRRAPRPPGRARRGGRRPRAVPVAGEGRVGRVGRDAAAGRPPLPRRHPRAPVGRPVRPGERGRPSRTTSRASCRARCRRAGATTRPPRSPRRPSRRAATPSPP